MAKRRRNASGATQLAVPMAATAALAGTATHLLMHKRDVTVLSTALGALIGLGLGLYTR